MAGWIYFIRATRDKTIKIGFTAGHPDARFRRLRATCSGVLEPIAVIEGPKRLEAELHARFIAHWSHGEWFHDAAEIRAYAAEHGTPWKPRPLAFRRPAAAVRSPQPSPPPGPAGPERPRLRHIVDVERGVDRGAVEVLECGHPGSTHRSVRLALHHMVQGTRRRCLICFPSPALVPGHP